MSSHPSPFRHNAFLNTVKQAYAATPYVLMVPGAIAGAHRAHKKKNPMLGGAISGGLGTGLGATFGGVGGSIAGMGLGKGFHNMQGDGPAAMFRRVSLGGEIGAAIGAIGGGYGAYKMFSNHFERRHRQGEDRVLKKYNLKRPKT